MRNLGNTCFIAAGLAALWSSGAARSALRARGGGLAARVCSVLEGGGGWPDLARDLRALLGSAEGEPHDCHELMCAAAEHCGLLPALGLTAVTAVACAACGAQPGPASEQPVAFLMCPPSASVSEGLLHAFSGTASPTGSASPCARCGGDRPSVLLYRARGRPACLVVRVAVPATRLDPGLSLPDGTRYALACAVDLSAGHYTAWAPGAAPGEWAVHDDGSGPRSVRLPQPPGLHTAVFDRLPP